MSDPFNIRAFKLFSFIVLLTFLLNSCNEEDNKTCLPEKLIAPQYFKYEISYQSNRISKFVRYREIDPDNFDLTGEWQFSYNSRNLLSDIISTASDSYLKRLIIYNSSGRYDSITGYGTQINPKYFYKIIRNGQKQIDHIDFHSEQSNIGNYTFEYNNQVLTKISFYQEYIDAGGNKITNDFNYELFFEDTNSADSLANVSYMNIFRNYFRDDLLVSFPSLIISAGKTLTGIKARTSEERNNIPYSELSSEISFLLTKNGNAVVLFSATNCANTYCSVNVEQICK